MTTRAPLFDRRLSRRRRARAYAQPGDGADFLLRQTVDELVERLGAVERSFALAVDIGSPSPYLAERLTGEAGVGHVWRVDALAASAPDVVAEDDLLPLREAAFDLAVSTLALHAVDDLPGALVQIRRALKPDGLFSGAFCGGDTLIELREALATAEAEIAGGAAPRVLPFTDIRDAGALLQRAGFALPVADRHRIGVTYGSVRALMHDLRAMGATNTLAERGGPLTRAIVARSEEVYRQRFAAGDGRLTATFDVLFLSGWAPHASQQRPLAPGSATARLADALGTSERSAGEKAPGRPASGRGRPGPSR